MSSIRARLAWGLIAALVPLFVASGVALHVTATHDLDRREQDALLVKAAAIAAAVGFDDGHIEVQAPARTSAGFARARHPDYYAVLAKDGTLLTSSPSAKEANWQPPVDDLADSIGTPIVLPRDRPGMATIITLHAGTDLEEEAREDPRVAEQLERGLRIVVADDVGGIGEEVERLEHGIIAIFGTAVLIACLVVVILLRRHLAPLDRMAGQAQDIDGANLDRRFEIGPVPDELAPIRDRLNDLLARLEDSFAREARFNSAVAHELRTPVAELRTMAEVALRWPDAQDNATLLRDVLAISVRMQSLIGALLMLRRVETEHEPMQLRPVLVAELLGLVVDRRRALAVSRALEVDIGAPDDLVVISQPELLDLIVDNWIANAFEYAPVRSSVAVAAHHADGHLVLEVSNDAPRLTPADLDHLFEPFWRKDDARSGDHHSGLGLTLTQSLAKALGGTVTASIEGSRLSLRLLCPASLATSAPMVSARRS
jgi:signal transduction histidine kinase